MTPREELEALRRLNELEAKAGGAAPDFGNVVSGSSTKMAPRTKKDYAGLAGRSIGQGVAGTLDMIGTGMKVFPGMALFNEATKGLPSIRDAANVALTNAGAARPRTARERVGSDIGEALTGTALTMGGGALAGSRFLTASPVLQGLGAVGGAGAMGTTREMGGGLLAQSAAAIAGGLAPAGIRAGGPMAVRGLLRGGEAGRETVLQNIADFADANTTPTVGQATQRWVPQAFESLLGKLPGSAGVIARKAQAQGDEIGAGVRAMADELSPGADAETAGAAIRDGITGRGPDSFKSRTQARGGLLYDRLGDQIDDASRVEVGNTARVMGELNQEIPGAPGMTPFFQNGRIGGIKSGFEADTTGAGAVMTRPGVPEWADEVRQSLQMEADSIAQQNAQRRALMQPELPVPTAADIDAQVQGRIESQVDGRLPYEAVRKTRTMVGNEVANANFASDVPIADWNRLYGGLSEDMRGAAEVAGPDAQRAFARATEHHRLVQKRSESIKHVVNRDTPEKIFAAATAGTKEGATTLAALMRSLPDGSRKEVAAAVLNRMGRATSGQQNGEHTGFSTSTFLTNWDTLSPKAQAALFSRFGPEFRDKVQAIVRTTANLRQGSKVYVNGSGTAASTAQIGGATALGGSLLSGNLPVTGGLLAGIGGANLLARAATSRGLPAWLGQKTPIPYSAAAPQGFLSQFLRDQEEEYQASNRQQR